MPPGAADEPAGGAGAAVASPPDDRPRLTLVISSLGVGGAERVLTTLANHWAAEGWSVTVLDLVSPGTPPFFPLDPRVAEVQLGLLWVSGNPLSAVVNNLRRMLVLRRAINRSRPGVVLSLMNKTNVLTLFAMALHPVPVVVAEHTAPLGTLSRTWSVLRNLAYRRAAAVVMLTHGALADLPPALRRRGRVIPNPLPPDVDEAAAGRPATGSADAPLAVGRPGGPTVMGLGRLIPEKGFDLLIAAFSQIVPEVAGVRLVIWGEGPERASLEGLRSGSPYPDLIELPGATREPLRALASATVFALPSRLEGMPMALIEAMAMGLPVVAADCDHGPRDIVRDGIDGLLVPVGDVPALAAAIRALLLEPGRRTELGRRATEVRARFALAAISGQWAALFREVSGARGA